MDNDMSHVPLFGGSVLDMSQVNTDTSGMDEAGYLPLPCPCNGTTSPCSSCYMLSPATSLVHDVSFTWPTNVAPGAEYPNPATSLFSGPDLDLFGSIDSPHQSAVFINPFNITNHISNTYALGDRSTEVVQPNDILITPVTTSPSINEDIFDVSQPFRIRDPTGKGRPGLYLTYDPDTYDAALQLSNLINTMGYRFHGTICQPGQESGIYALQKALSFHLTERVPATVEQFNTLLRSIQLANETDQYRLPLELSEVLYRYGLQVDVRYRLGVISSGALPFEYTTAVYGSEELPILWLFYDLNGEDMGSVNHWYAVIPVDTMRKGSYAAALTSPAPNIRTPSIYDNVSDGSLLHPRYETRQAREQRPPTRSKRPAPIPRTPPGRATRSQRQNKSTRGRRSGCVSHTPSEAGSPEAARHQCTLCPKSFLYPKDLRRHQTTHSSAKNVKCMLPGCPKAFTRMDNCRRHMQNDHGIYTPAPTVIST